MLGASLAALELIRTEPGLRRELHEKVTLFKNCLQAGGFVGDLGPSQIVPVRIGDSRLALEIACLLRAQGIFATAVRPPTVPKGTARLRFSITRHHQRAVLEKTARLLLALL